MESIIKFAHLADLHLGAFREKKLTQLNFITFKKAIAKIIEKQMDFCIFSGDIFNNAMPPIELVTQVVDELMKLKKAEIPLYIIGGSHDYSISGKSFIELLDTAKVFTNVAKYKFIDKNKIELIQTIDKKTQTSITGIVGKKNELEKNTYQAIQKTQQNQDNFNIFLFHTTLNDFKPKFIKNHNAKITTSMLPKGFDYYAGGHIHTFMTGVYDSKPITYPGALFPNNFTEIVRETPGFNICEYNKQTKQTKIKHIELQTYNKIHIKININKLNPVEAKNKIIETIETHNIAEKLLLLEIEGTVEGKIVDINITSIIKQLYQKGVFHVLKNTYKLKSSLIQQINNIPTSQNIEELEEQIIKGNITNTSSQNKEYKIMKNLLKLELKKQEGEKIAQFEERCIENIKKAVK